MTIRVLLLVAVIGALFTGGVYAEELNPVVGKAGDFVLREADLERLISAQPPELQRKLQAEPQQRLNLVRQVLIAKAVAARAKKEGLDKKPEVKEQLSYLVDQYLAQEYIRKTVAANVAVPDEELKKFYDEHVKDFLLPETAKVRHIFVKVPGDASAEVKGKARSKAEELLQRVKKGEDFAKLAKEISEDEDSAEKGGELGTLSPGKTNSEAFEKVVFALKAGELSPIVETPFGFHIVRVDERTENRTAAFDEVKEFIRNKLRGEIEQKKVQEFLDKLVKEAGLEVAEEKSTDLKEKGK